MLENIPQESLYVKGYDMEFPVINEKNNDMTIVYGHAKRPFSLRIRIINANANKKKVLVTDNYDYAVRTPINRVRKALKAYFKAYGYKTLFAMHA
ncbi:MAG: hypothetical protein VZQ62_07810 [Methanosphaera sp.]|nr:hypothetical protein [Methanosphaera sp.]